MSWTRPFRRQQPPEQAEVNHTDPLPDGDTVLKPDQRRTVDYLPAAGDPPSRR